MEEEIGWTDQHDAKGLFVTGSLEDLHNYSPPIDSQEEIAPDVVATVMVKDTRTGYYHPVYLPLEAATEIHQALGKQLEVRGVAQ